MRSSPTTTITQDLRQQILRHVAANSARLDPAEAVTSALLVAAVNVRAISLDDWKSIIFDAFQATRGSSA